MPRSLARSGALASALAALLAGMLLLAIAPRPARAADPTPDPFLDAAAAAGLPCRDVDEGSWHCEDLEALDDRSFFATVDDDEAFGFHLSVYRGLQDPAPAEPEVLGLMDRFIVLALGGEDAEIRAWLTEMHDTRSDVGSIERDAWTFDWYADWEGNDEGIEAAVQLIMTFNPAWEPRSPGQPDNEVADPCTLLTESEVESVTGMEAQPGVTKETGTVGQIGCGWGTAPYEVQVAVTPSTGGAAVDGLGDSGYPVDDLGDGAFWWWCDTCADVDASSSSNRLVVASGAVYVDIGFDPTTDAAAGEAFRVQEEQRAWAVELARLILPRLEEGSAPVPSSPPSMEPDELPESSLGVWTYDGVWTLVAFENDAGDEPILRVGTERPTTLTVTCLLADTCTTTWDDGPPRGEPVYVPDAPGRISSTFEWNRDECGAVSTQVIEFAFGPARATGTSAETTLPLSCVVGTRTTYFYDYTWTFGGTLVGFVPVEGSSEDPDPGAAPVPGTPDAPGGADSGFVGSIPAPTQVSTDPIVLLQSVALAALVVFLMPFPSQLFNSTLETHEDEVKRWFRLDRLGAAAGGIGAFWSSWAGVIVFTVVAAVLYGFLDPGFGFDIGSLATFVGMLVGIVVVTGAFALPLIAAHRRHGDRPSIKVVPVSLAIGVACVLLSRLTSFQPGYLYGLLIGLVFARELSAADEGRATAIGAGLMLAVAFAAWLALGALPDGEAFGLVVARTALAALMVAGLEGVVFGLLPMRFLPGESLFRWNRVLWAGILLLGAFAFFHILINPASGYLSDTSRTPLFTVVALLLGFSLVSVAFWAWFRFRSDRPAPEGPVR